MQELLALLSQGLQPDAESARARRVRRRVMWALVTVLATILIARAFTLRSAPRPTIRAGMYVVWVALAITALCALLYRRRIAKHPESRRMMYTGLLMMTGASAARACATACDISVDHYLPIELCWLAAMLATELPLVGRRYVWPLLVCLVLLALIITVPQYGPIYLNPGYALMIAMTVSARMAARR
jgi:hypothetical protein